MQIKKITYDHFLIYLLILFKMGHFFTDNLNALTAPLLILFLLLAKKRNVICKPVIYVVVALFVLTNITYFFKGFPSTSQYIVLIVHLITPVLFLRRMNAADFMEKFSEIILVICLFSIVAWFLCLVRFPFSSIAPTLTNTNSYKCQFLILAFVQDSIDGLPRLHGLAWEPGAFQILITISMLFQMYNIESERNRLITRNRIIFTIAAILTFSTTGYISLFLVYLLLFLKSQLGKSIRVFCIILISVGCFFFINEAGEIYNNVFGKKLAEMALYEPGADKVGTATTRMDSIVFPWMLFKQSPLVGIGDSGYEYISNLTGHSMFTCTPLNYFAKFGLIYGIICFLGFVKLTKLKGKTIIESTLLLLTLLLTVISEQVAFNPLFTTLILYGYSMNSTMHNQSACLA